MINLLRLVHITKIYHAAFYHLHNIRRIRKYLSMDAAATLIHSFVSSRIDYCSSLLYGVPKCHIDKLQRVQNAATRLVIMQGKFCLIIPVLHQLHWLPVSFRINFKILLLTFKAIHELSALVTHSWWSRETPWVLAQRIDQWVRREQRFRKCGPLHESEADNCGKNHYCNPLQTQETVYCNLSRSQRNEASLKAKAKRPTTKNKTKCKKQRKLTSCLRPVYMKVRDPR